MEIMGLFEPQCFQHSWTTLTSAVLNLHKKGMEMIPACTEAPWPSLRSAERVLSKSMFQDGLAQASRKGFGASAKLVKSLHVCVCVCRLVQLFRETI